MDEIRIGRQIRALRRRRAWRQQDLAAACGTSRSSVSRLERGRVREVSVALLGRVAAALDARLDLRLSWNGEALDRLLDADHAALVERVGRLLTSLGWEVPVEVSFNIRGERGSIDIVAFHPPTGALLVAEIKSVVPDVQATIVVLDRKARLGREIARERGWGPTMVGRLLVIGASRTARRRVAQHRTTFESAFPDRGVAVRRWLVDPSSNPRFSGLKFLPIDQQVAARQRVTGSAAPRLRRRPRLLVRG